MGLVGILLGLAAIVMVSIVGAILALIVVIAMGQRPVRSDVTDLREPCDHLDAIATYNRPGSTS